MFCLIAHAAGFGHRIMFESNKATCKRTPVKTEKHEYVIKEMQHLFQLKGWQTKAVIYDGCNKIRLIYLIGDINDNRNMLIESMEVYGWSFSFQENQQVDTGHDVITLHFDPMFQEPIKGVKKISPILYHWTPFINMTVY